VKTSSIKRIAAILIAITLLFSAGATLADDTGEANKLFVEAMQLSMSTEDEGSLEKKAAALEASQPNSMRFLTNTRPLN